MVEWGKLGKSPIYLGTNNMPTEFQLKLGTPTELHEWSVNHDLKAIYQPPELRTPFLSGKCKRYEGRGLEFISTSYIKKVEGRVVTTFSGSQYLLMEPAEDYVTYCLEKGCHDPRNKIEPIKTKKEESDICV